MSKLEITPAVVTINGRKYDATPCVVASTSLGYEDHGILTAMLHVKGDSWGVGLGGFALDGPYNKDTKQREDQPACGMFIREVMACVGVGSWEKLVGQHVHALWEHGSGRWGVTARGVASADLSRGVVFADLFKKAGDA